MLYGEVEQAFGAWVMAGWKWEAFMTGTFRRPRGRRPRLPAQRGDRRLPLRSARVSSPVPCIGTEVVFDALMELHRWLAEVPVLGCAPYWIAAIEPHKYRGARDHHAHLLLGGLGEIRREQIWRWWYDRFGVARVEPVQDLGAALYIGKYIAKGAEVRFSPGLEAARMQAQGER